MQKLLHVGMKESLEMFCKVKNLCAYPRDKGERREFRKHWQHSMHVAWQTKLSIQGAGVYNLLPSTGLDAEDTGWCKTGRPWTEVSPTARKPSLFIHSRPVGQ